MYQNEHCSALCSTTVKRHIKTKPCVHFVNAIPISLICLFSSVKNYIALSLSLSYTSYLLTYPGTTTIFWFWPPPACFSNLAYFATEFSNLLLLNFLDLIRRHLSTFPWAFLLGSWTPILILTISIKCPLRQS